MSCEISNQSNKKESYIAAYDLNLYITSWMNASERFAWKVQRNQCRHTFFVCPCFNGIHSLSIGNVRKNKIKWKQTKTYQSKNEFVSVHVPKLLITILNGFFSVSESFCQCYECVVRVTWDLLLGKIHYAYLSKQLESYFIKEVTDATHFVQWNAEQNQWYQ